MVLIGFLTAGDSDIPTCMECVKQLEQNSCDTIGIGIPFLDPTAEGPVIQEVSLCALQSDITAETAMRMVSSIREFSQIPLVFFPYYNQIFKYEASRFLRESEAVDIDVLIIPDFPAERREELKPLADVHHAQLIPLVTPASSARKKSIAEQSEGFLYCVTSLGVTGERTEFQAGLKAFLSELSAYSDMPKVLGFGISTPQQITEMRSYVDGVIAGSAIVRQTGRLAKQEITPEKTGSLVKTLADAAHAQKGTMRPLFVPITTNASSLLQMYLLYQPPPSAHVNRRLLYPTVMIYQLSTSGIHAEAKMHSLFPLYGSILCTSGQKNPYFKQQIYFIRLPMNKEFFTVRISQFLSRLQISSKQEIQHYCIYQ